MTRTRRYRAAVIFGLIALVAFVVEAVILQAYVRPAVMIYEPVPTLTGVGQGAVLMLVPEIVMPQSALAPYTRGDLLNLQAALMMSGLTDLYRLCLMYFDSVFLLGFLGAVWCVSPARRAVRGTALMFLLADFTENALILKALEQPGSGLLYPPLGVAREQVLDGLMEPSPIFAVTVTKWGLLLICLLAMFVLQVRKKA